MLLDFLSLDRSIGAAARAHDALATRAGSLPQSPPIPREVSTRTLLVELEAFSGEPLAEALRPWVARLTLERVTWRERVALASALEATDTSRARRPDEGAPVEALAESAPGVREALVALLRERVPERLAGHERALVAAAPPAHEAFVRWAARRAEAEHTLFTGRARPSEPPSMALSVLAATDDSLPRPEGLASALTALMGRDASRGWPRLAGPRFVGHALRETSLLSGVSLDGREREPLGASSFARELERAGVRFFDVATSGRGRPFVTTRAADDRAREAMAALFASLVLVPSFHARVLALGRREVVGQLRALGRVTLLHLRVLALRAWLARESREGRVPADLADQSARVLGAPLAPRLVGVVPRLDHAPEAKLDAALVALASHAGLRERFDEDWFRNPRAAEALREEPDPLGVAGLSQAAREGLVQRALAELTF